MILTHRNPKAGRTHRHRPTLRDPKSILSTTPKTTKTEQEKN